MQTSTPQFVTLCRLLVQSMEEVPEAERGARREEILDRLMGLLMSEGLVFDRAYAGLLFDQLQVDPDAAAAPLSAARLDELRERVRRQDYVNEAVLRTMGDRLLWVLGSS